MLPGRSLTARAVIALALTVGFYALALSMVLFLVWLPYASVVYLRLNALCVQAEIADIELGTVRDALRGL